MAFKKIDRGLTQILGGGLIIFVIVSLLPLLLSPAVIVSDSMAPAIRTGDIIIIDRDFDPSRVSTGSRGDIVVIAGPSVFLERGVPSFVYAHLSKDTPIVHRAIDKRIVNGEYYFITKGDNNPYADGCFRYVDKDGDTYASFEFNASDPVLVPADRIIGTVKVIIPGVGYLRIHGKAITVHLIGLLVVILLVKNRKLRDAVVTRETLALLVPSGE